MPNKPSINTLMYRFFGGGTTAQYNYYAGAAAAGVDGTSSLGVAVRDKGLTLPTYGLEKFHQSTRTLRRIALYGDSVVQGRNDPAGSDVFADHLRTELRNRGFTVHDGLQPFWNRGTNGVSPAWAAAGTWSAATATRQLAPHGQTATGIASMATASANTAIATWTRPSATQVTQFDIWYVDHTGGGAEFSYSIDNGSTYLPIATARPATPTLTKFSVTGVSNPTNIKVRAATAANVAAVIPGFLGIEVRSGSAGIVVDNVGFAGAGWCGRTATAGAVRDRDGDWGAWFDATQPELIYSMFSNDISNSPFVLADIETAIRTVRTRTSTYADLVLGNWPLQYSTAGLRSYANQIAIYGLSRSLATELGLGLADFHQRWGEFGVQGADTTAAFASGLWRNEAGAFSPTYIHPIAKGTRDIGAAIARLIQQG